MGEIFKIGNRKPGDLVQRGPYGADENLSGAADKAVVIYKASTNQHESRVLALADLPAFPSTSLSDYGSINGASALANRTRHMGVAIFNATGSSSVPAVDTHGALSTFSHYHLADGATTELQAIGGVRVPKDFVSGLTLNYQWSSTVGSNNLYMLHQVYSTPTGATTDTALLAGFLAITVPAGANTKTITSVACGAPGANDVIQLTIDRIGADPLDTNTGQMSIWAAWLEYTADS